MIFFLTRFSKIQAYISNKISNIFFPNSTLERQLTNVIDQGQRGKISQSKNQIILIILVIMMMMIKIMIMIMILILIMTMINIMMMMMMTMIIIIVIIIIIIIIIVIIMKVIIMIIVIQPMLTKVIKSIQNTKTLRHKNVGNEDRDRLWQLFMVHRDHRRTGRVSKSLKFFGQNAYDSGNSSRDKLKKKVTVIPKRPKWTMPNQGVWCQSSVNR